MLRHARSKVNARRFDARMPENIRQLDDILVCAIKCRREQVAQIMGKYLVRFHTSLTAQPLQLRPYLFPRNSVTALGEKDLTEGDFLLSGVFEEFSA